MNDYPMLFDDLEEYCASAYDTPDPFGSFEDAQDTLEKLIDDLNDYDQARDTFGETLREDHSVFSVIPRGKLSDWDWSSVAEARDVLAIAEAAIEMVRNVDIGHPLDMTELRRAVRDVALVRFE